VLNYYVHFSWSKILFTKSKFYFSKSHFLFDQTFQYFHRDHCKITVSFWSNILF